MYKYTGRPPARGTVTGRRQTVNYAKLGDNRSPSRRSGGKSQSARVPSEPYPNEMICSSPGMAAGIRGLIALAGDNRHGVRASTPDSWTRQLAALMIRCVLGFREEWAACADVSGLIRTNAAPLARINPAHSGTTSAVRRPSRLLIAPRGRRLGAMKLWITGPKSRDETGRS
jgi:hypothetical protein